MTTAYCSRLKSDFTKNKLILLKIYDIIIFQKEYSPVLQNKKKIRLFTRSINIFKRILFYHSQFKYKKDKKFITKYT